MTGHCPMVTSFIIKCVKFDVSGDASFNCMCVCVWGGRGGGGVVTGLL